MFYVLGAFAAAVGFTAGVLLWIRRTHLLVTVKGASMEPAFHDGEQVIVRRRPPDELRRGQAVVLLALEWEAGYVPAEARGTAAHPAPEVSTTSHVIKRVAAVPGDPLPREQVPVLRHVAEPRVPRGKVILLGDNAAASFDSRRHGYFDIENVIGPVIWPRPS
ncbi:S26 family signal peptidase [Nonomuraea typhae]|uniref:S26 family signal peptidase n=1 Tax=Nonomuraea typhae TaxID=2603600 RepID=UPI0012FAF401|nr:S26 family signal peptidase [Nonomuraea typhae]